MSRFGRYEVVEELYRTAMATVSRARANAIGESKFVVKAFTPPEFGDDASGGAAEASFTERATLQQKVAAQKASRHWAAVYDVGREAGAAYFVTDYYPLTAQRLITGRVPMNPTSLHRLVSAVVRGLRELKAVADRPHGNLKPANVLIAGHGGDAAAAAGVVLADPAPSSRLATWGEQSDDLVALGHLIHQLVLHRPFRSPGGWPLEASAEWVALGRFADGWRDLTNRLLDPTGQQRPADLDDVARLVTRLGSNRKRRVVQLAAALALLGVIMTGAGFGGYRLDKAHRAAVQAANDGWLGELERRKRERPRTIETYRTDPALASLLDAVDAAHARGVRFDLPRDLPRDKTAVDAFRQARDVAAVVSDLSARLTPAAWPTLKDATARVDAFRARGWEQPASELRRVLDGLAPAARGASFWNAVDELLALRSHALGSDAEIDRAWQALEKSLALPLRAGGEPARVRDAMAARARAAVRLTPAGITGAEQVSACASAVVAWASLDRTGFDAAALTAKLAEAKLEITPAADPAALASFASRVGPDVAVVKIDATPDLKAAVESFEKTKAFADRDEKDEPTRQAYERAKSGVAAQIAKLTTSGGTPADAKALRDAVDAFARRWSSASDPTAWLRTAKAPPAVSSDALKEAWRRWLRAAGLSAENVVDAAVTPGRRKQAAELREALAALDKRFPPPDPALPEAFAEAAGERREQELARVVARPVPPDSPLPAELLDPDAARPYTAWLTNLAALAKEFPLKQPLLDDPVPRPDEAWAKRDPDFWKDPAVQRLVRADVRRLNDLSGLGKETDRATLVATATGEEPKAELVIAAWRRLPALDPPWPADVAELETESKARAKIAAMAAAFPAAARARIESELATQGLARWCAVVNGLGAAHEKPFDAAAGRASAFGVAVDPATGAAPADVPLTPAARFNLLLRAARAAAANAADDADAARLAASFAASVPAEVKPRVAMLAAGLSKLDRKPWFPAAAKRAGDGRMTLSVTGLPRDLEFVRVQAAGVPAFYLCTTECSLAVFLAAAGDPKALLANPAPPEGPSVWSWGGGGGAVKPGIGELSYWLPNDSPSNKIGFAPALRQGQFNRWVLSDAAGGAPTVEHPMQKLSPAAALTLAGALGCRLPTSGEWSAALVAVKDVKDWNLRDATWQKQQAFVANPPQGAAGAWPDAGAFVPAGASVARAAQAKALPSDDGTLFFRPVGPDAGKTFSHLVGNVAEFTFDAPEAFEDLADKRPAGVVALLKQRAAAVKVIGGSALSAPEIPTDKPQPVADANAAYADVGFRLAFSEPAGSPLARLRAALAGRALLSPKGD